MANRQQRFSNYFPLQMGGGPDQDAIEYTVGGSKITLGVFPRLGSFFPDVPRIEVPVRSGATAPPQLPFTRGGMSMKEVSNESFFVYVVGLSGGFLPVEDGIPHSSYQAVGIIADQSGKVIKLVIGHGEDVADNHADFAKYALHRLDFDKNAKPLDRGKMVTKVNQVDENTLTHTFSASFFVPGGGSFQTGGNVRELIRNRGGIPNGSFSYWKRGYTWQVGGKIAAIVEDFAGKFHVVTFTAGGGTLLETTCSNFQTAISTAYRSLNE